MTPLESAVDAVRGALGDNPCVLIERRGRVLYERHYFSDPELRDALFAGMRQLAKECVCRWPDGSLRDVVVLSITDGQALIIWNERHQDIEGQGRVAGMQETVPADWLFIPMKQS